MKVRKWRGGFPPLIFDSNVTVQRGLLIDLEPGKRNFDNDMAAYDLFENLFKKEKIEVVTKNGLRPSIGPKILKDVVYV